MQREYVLGVGVSRVYKVYIEEKHTDRECVFVERRRYMLWEYGYRVYLESMCGRRECTWSANIDSIERVYIEGEEGYRESVFDKLVKLS